MKPTRGLSAAAAVAFMIISGMSAGSAAAGPLPPIDDFLPTDAPVALPQGAWSLLYGPSPPDPTNLPAIRLLHTAVYDPIGDRMLVFGGENSGGAFNDTWSLSLSGGLPWTPLPAGGILPTPRRDHTAIYDPVRHRMIVFGGSGHFDSYMNDTYALSLSGTPTWSHLPLAAAPPGRFAHTAIYDPVRDRMIVFGGYDGATFRSDVWQLTLSGTPTWSRIIPGGTPPAGRNALTAIYDPVRDRMLFFGGWDGTNFRSDVWGLNLSGSPVWTRVGTSGAVPSRRHYVAVYDPSPDRLVISGGEDWGGLHNDSYALSLSGSPTWSAIPTSGSPPSPRAASRAILDPVRGRMVLFGGYDINYLNDTHALALASPQTWSRLTPGAPPAVPTPRRDHVAAYDPLRDRMIVFGGWDGSFRNDTWALSLSGAPAWTEIVPAGGAPPPRFAHTGVYDAASDRLVVFGGFDGTFRNDVWALSLSGTPTWTQIHPSGPAPAGRNALTAIFDPVRQRLLFFGGWDGTAYRDDAWTLNLNGPPAWTELSPFTGALPSARRHYAAIYDPPRDQLVISGGLDGAYLNDSWALGLGGSHGPDWQRLASAQRLSPSERNAHRAVYDSPRDRMVEFGGYGGTYLQDTWALSLTTPRQWTNLSPAGTPPAPRLLHTAIYDPVRDRILVFGGEGLGNVRFNDTWALDFGGAAQTGGQRQSDASARGPSRSELAVHGVHPNPWGGTEGLTVSLSLPGSGPARLELFTVSGRRVLVRDVGSFGAGDHDVLLDPGASLPPGLYMVRLSSGRGSHWTKVAKLR